MFQVYDKATIKPDRVHSGRPISPQSKMIVGAILT